MIVKIKDKKLKRLYRLVYAYQKLTRGGLAGQAFTSYTCIKCESDHVHTDTNIPILCDSCFKGILTEYQDECKQAKAESLSESYRKISSEDDDDEQKNQ